MNHLRVALNHNDDAFTRLPRHLVLALNGQATELPDTWQLPANIIEAKQLLLLRQELPLDAIDTLVGVGHDGDVEMLSDDIVDMVDTADGSASTNRVKNSMHVDVDDDEAMLSSTFEDRINDLADQLHTAATTAFHDEIVDEAAIDHIKTILERVLTYSNQQMALILTRSKDVLAQVSDNQFAHLVNMMLNLLVANTSATTSYRVCLVQHLVLPKLCHATTRPTRHLQQLLADIARQEPHAYAHGILFHWPRVCSLETWHADTIRKTVQNIPAMLPYLDAVLCHWGSNPFSNNLVHTSIQPIQWNNTLYALATFLLELPMTSSTSSTTTTTTRSDTIRILTRLLARQDAKTITGIKFGLLAIALARQNANHQSSSVEIATTLDDIANKMRPMQARQLRQCLQKTKLPSNGNNTNANDK